MIAAFQEVLYRLRDAYRHGSSLVLLFDYDGTLTPIVEHPRLAILDHQTRRLLAHLADRPRVHVGVLSGRGLDEVKSLVSLPGLYLAGTGGMELELRGARIVHPRAAQMAGTMKRLAEHLESEISVYQGAWLEKKKLGLTVHYRQMPGKWLACLQTAVAEVMRDFAREVRIVQGPRAWEITPAEGWSKGTAVRLILADLAATSDVLFYAGDGANDAEAIEEVTTMGGITLGIGPDAPSASDYRLPNHTALRAFLSHLDTVLEKRKSRLFRELSPSRLVSLRRSVSCEYPS